jgi:hypothetical protein
MTPLPGTPAWRPELWDPTGRAFRRFSFLSAYRPHDGLTVLERALLFSLLFHWPPARFRTYLGSLWNGDARKRRIAWRLGWRGASHYVGQFLRSLWSEDLNGGLVFPAWYES